MHTPIPWKLEIVEHPETETRKAYKVASIKNLNDEKLFLGSPTAHMEQGQNIVNAEFIIKAVNNHEALVKALQEVQDMSKRWMDGTDPHMGNALTAAKYHKVAKDALKSKDMVTSKSVT